MEEMSVIGKSVHRYDGLMHVTGQTKYVNDIYLPGMCYIKTRNSEHFNAKILSVDTTEAERMPGVVGVVTAKDVPNNRFGLVADQPVLADTYVRHLGQPIVAVVATSERLAQEAADKVKVVFEVMPSVFDPIEAMEPGATPAHDGAGSSAHPNIAQNGKYDHRRIRPGDVDEAFRQADLIVEDTYSSQMREHVPLETHVAVGQVDATGKLTIWTVSQAVHQHQRFVSYILNIPFSKLRMIGGTLGGGFGSKNELLCDHLVGLAALKTGRPVKWLWTREEEFLNSSVNAPYPLFSYRTAVKKDGTMTAMKVKAIQDGGAYTIYSLVGINKLGIMARGPYRTSSYWYDGYVVYTNKPSSGAQRGFNLAEACFGWEQHVDHIAEELGMDRLAFRLKNVQVMGDTTTTGDPMESISIRECLIAAAKTAGWPLPKSEGGDGSTRDFAFKSNAGSLKKRGMGICAQHQVMGLPYGGDPSQAEIQIMGDGSAHLRMGTVDLGQGAKTVTAMIAAEEIGIPYESITVTNADTETTPLDGGSYANRCTFFMGNAVRRAAAEVKQLILQEASGELGTPPEALDLKNGTIFVKDHPEQAVSLADVANNSIWKQGKFFLGRGAFYPNAGYPGDDDTSQGKPYDSYMFAAGIADLEVDTETGQIDVKNMYMAYDCGKALNPRLVEGQFEGGCAAGIGGTIMENMLPYYPSCDYITKSLSEYMIGTSLDLAKTKIHDIIVEVPHPRGPFGAKGMGEFTSNVQAAAIANALYDATGVRVTSLPLTPERVLRALKEAEKKADK
ncbi:MAG: xanthine dehydrogenase family protein molybdopterin-binding subunit [Chloroflexi bacterium]|nr:xanthine dehydrogenase family protein molybdopterin-binding subunit [Chloroflexota bacterium]